MNTILNAVVRSQMVEEWRERRARNAINSTEAEGVKVSLEATRLGLDISRGKLDADTAIAEYWRNTTNVG